MSAWASDLAVGIAADQATQHVAIFVLDDRGDDLRLAAQVWGAGEDTGAVIVGDWTVPLDGSAAASIEPGSRLCAPTWRWIPTIEPSPAVGRGRH